jgi:opacity protein-like surface antigen
LALLPAFVGPSAQAGEGTPYLGVFGGGGVSRVDSVNQVGTALFPEVMGGPLNVNAVGGSATKGVGIAGLHLGYAWDAAVGANGDSWSLVPAVELEGFYMGGAQHANVSDPNNRLEGHDFSDAFSLNSGVFLTNAVLSLQSPVVGLTPYVGVGVGSAGMTISGADSLQVVPDEPGVNHFNAKTSDSSWGFASQAKVGVRFNLTERAYLFTEYRFLYVGATDYTFGPTVYSTHVPTTPWTVHFGDTYLHTAVAGIGFKF